MSCTFLKKYATPTGFWNELPFKEACKRFSVWVALFLKNVQLQPVSKMSCTFLKKTCSFLDMDCTFLKKYATVAGFCYEFTHFSKSENRLQLHFSQKCATMTDFCSELHFVKEYASIKLFWLHLFSRNAQLQNSTGSMYALCPKKNCVIQRVFHRLAQGTLANSMCNSSTNRNSCVFLVDWVKILGRILFTMGFSWASTRTQT
jgi:hypothetical protein